MKSKRAKPAEAGRIGGFREILERLFGPDSRPADIPVAFTWMPLFRGLLAIAGIAIALGLMRITARFFVVPLVIAGIGSEQTANLLQIGMSVLTFGSVLWIVFKWPTPMLTGSVRQRRESNSRKRM